MPINRPRLSPSPFRTLAAPSFFQTTPHPCCTLLLPDYFPRRTGRQRRDIAFSAPTSYIFSLTLPLCPSALLSFSFLHGLFHPLLLQLFHSERCVLKLYPFVLLGLDNGDDSYDQSSHRNDDAARAERIVIRRKLWSIPLVNRACMRACGR
jgi:hypothetical protein